MAQVCTVVQADPWTLASTLDAYTSGVLVAEKTSSSGKFIIVSDDSLPSQTFVVIAGGPDKLANAITDLITGGATIELIIPTFSASHYVVAYI